MADKTVFHKLSYGLYIIASRRSGASPALNGQVANTLFQVSAAPEQVAVALNKENLTYQLVKESGVFSASILREDAPMALIGHFGFQSGRDCDKFATVEHHVARATGAPIVLPGTVGWVEVEVSGELDAVTHGLFIGRVLDTGTTSGGAPMTYAYYHEVKRGKSPPRAPITQIEEPAGASRPAGGGRQYRCSVCGYVHDPAREGRTFEDLPEGWTCPVCGSPRSVFEPEP